MLAGAIKDLAPSKDWDLSPGSKESFCKLGVGGATGAGLWEGGAIWRILAVRWSLKVRVWFGAVWLHSSGLTEPRALARD